MPDMRFRSAVLDDLDALVALEEAVERSLPHRDMFAIDGRDFYVPIVAGAGHILLAEDSAGGLVGVSVIRFPAEDDQEHLGHELRFSPEQLARVRHLESVSMTKCMARFTRGYGKESYNVLLRTLHLPGPRKNGYKIRIDELRKIMRDVYVGGNMPYELPEEAPPAP